MNDEVTRRLYDELDFVFSNSAALVGGCFFLFKSFLWASFFFFFFSLCCGLRELLVDGCFVAVV